MKVILWLDDVRNPKDFIKDYDANSVVWVKDYSGFVEFVNEGKLPDIVDFDHDLGEGRSGYDCAKYLVNWCIDNDARLPEIVIHSSNPVGKDNIESLVNSYRKVYCQD